MKSSSYLNVCRHSAKRIKNLLDKSKNQLLSYTPAEESKKSDFPVTHKCDHIKLSQTLLHMDKLCTQEFETSKLKCKEFQDKQRTINLSHCSGVPMNTLDHGAVSTQCCVNQKHVNHFFLFEAKRPDDILSRRHIQRGFREYLLASRQFKSMATHAIPNARKYQIAILKDENAEEKQIPPIDWMPIKMEERLFLMGHTVKHLQ
jgi:hypothetical protein